MSAPGFTSILLYSSSTAASVPLPANLAQGELAINTADGKLFYKDSLNAVQVIGWKNVPVSAGGTGTTTSTGTGSVVLNNNPSFPTDITVSGLKVGKGSGTSSGLTSNVVVGYLTLGNTSSGIRNVGMGVLALGNNTTGSDNVGLGYQAMYLGTTGSYNVALGYAAMAQTSTGSSNVAIGNQTLLYNGAGDNNTAVGAVALYSNAGGSNNTALGNSALFSSTGSRNIGIGYSAGQAISSGSNNVVLGSYTGNSGGLDIRTSSNNVVLSDGDGNIRQVVTSNNKVLFGTTSITGNIGSVFNNSGYALALETLDSANSTLLGNIKRISKALGGTADPSYGYVLLVPAYNGGSPINKSRFSGTIYAERGAVGAFNITAAIQLSVASAYIGNSYGAVNFGNETLQIVTCTYAGSLYVALRTDTPQSARNLTIDGLYTDNFTPVLVADGTVSNVTVLDTYTQNIASNVSGTVAAINGGTGLSTYTTGDIIYANATNTLTKLGIGSTGQVLKVAGGVPTWGASSTLATNSGLTSLTTINATTTYTTGGITLASQTAEAGSVWRVRAYGNYLSVASATARNAQVACFWGSTQLTALTVAVGTNLAQTSGWNIEFELTATSTTAIWTTGQNINKIGSSTYNNNNITTATGPSITVTAGAQTIDLRFSMSNASMADEWRVSQVTMERIK